MGEEKKIILAENERINDELEQFRALFKDQLQLINGQLGEGEEAEE